MSQKANYFKIGLFVVGAISLAVIGIVVLGAGKWFENKTMVETYFSESVQGLEVGAPVRIRGVPVGRVEAIGLAREEYQLPFNPKVGLFPYRGLVLVRMSVRPTVVVQLKEEDEETVMKMAVDAGFRFRLASQGITGVLYIESEFLQPERYPPMEISWTPKYPYVPSAPSAISDLGTDVRALVRKLDQVEYDRIANDLMATLAAVTQMVKEVQAEQLGKEAKQLLADLRRTIVDAQLVLDDPNLKKVLKIRGGHGGFPSHRRRLESDGERRTRRRADAARHDDAPEPQHAAHRWATGREG